MKLNNKNWNEYSFGDVAFQQKESVDRENTTLDKYVAGKHMSTEDIHIRKWGTLGENYLGPAFIRKFSKNDILYGSRRTYLKKVAVARFDGITANTTFVIKPNDEFIVHRLLPFLMLSDSFTNHSVKNSKGSVNPYINWKDIANYKFKLPPLDEQKRLADLLWSVDKVIEKYMLFVHSLDLFSASLFYKSINSRVNKFTEIESVLVNIEYGLSEKLAVKAKYPVLRMNNLQNGDIDLNDLKFVNMDNKIANKYMLKNNDILFNRVNSFELVGKTSIFKNQGQYLFASYLLRLQVNKKIIDPDYLNYYMNSDLGIASIRKFRTPGVSQSNVNAKNLLKVKVPVIPISEQKKVVSLMNNIKANQSMVNQYIESNKIILANIINSLFG